MSRCTLFLLKVHHKQIIGSRQLLTLLHQLDDALRSRLAAEQATVGYNLAAMRFMRQNLETKAEARFFQAALVRRGLGPRPGPRPQGGVWSRGRVGVRARVRVQVT